MGMSAVECRRVAGERVCFDRDILSRGGDMKHKLLTIATMFAAVLVLSAIPGFSAIHDTLTANVPFSFVVGHTTLPAGQYEIKTPDYNARHILMIRPENGGQPLMVMAMPITHGISVSHETELIFDKLGNHEFLRQVWEQNYTRGDQLREPMAEEEMLAVAAESRTPSSATVSTSPAR
jgi:hypothetical protein